VNEYKQFVIETGQELRFISWKRFKKLKKKTEELEAKRWERLIKEE
jgi:hypothetical protein